MATIRGRSSAMSGFAVGHIASLLLLVMIPCAHAQESKPAQITVESVEPSLGGLGTQITITLGNIPAAPAPDFSKWVVHLDGMPLEGVVPDAPISPDGKLRFTLRRSDSDLSKATWGKLFHPLGFNRRVSVSVGPANVTAVAAPWSSTFVLTIIPKTIVSLITLAYLILILLVLWLGHRSNMVREPGADPTAGHKPFSLGRAQMAFWFLVVVGAYLFIGLITLDFYNTISVSSLVLLGISAATALGAGVIDGDKWARAQRLGSERDAVAAQVPALTNAAVTPQGQQNLVAAQKKLGDISSELDTLPATGPRQSKGLMMDLISDEDGVSLHRLQMVVWTIVLGAVFLGGVARDFGMPEFNTTLLALMGISSGTYLGFKVPERK
jgi:hypothetical protein